MITPVGANAEMTAAAVKAGINRYTETNFYNKNYEPMKMALVPDEAIPKLNKVLAEMPGVTARQRRMLRLLTPALDEVLSSIPLKEAVPLFLAGPETLPDCPTAIDNKFIDYLATQTEVNIDKKLSRIIATGRAGGIQAIDLAIKYFEAMGKDVALVGGVDSYKDHYLLSRLDNEDRVLSAGSMEAFAPGEAAGILLLVSERVVNKLPNKPLASLFLPGIDAEVGHRYSDGVYTGDGLSNAFKTALASSNGIAKKSIYTSLNGESFGAKELGVAVLRNKEYLDENYTLEHPADCFGDVGAAIGPILIGLIANNKTGNYLAYCSSETSARASIAVNI
jgi:3-oxoacyl-[acyl-carrier-protein] synthase-1